MKLFVFDIDGTLVDRTYLFKKTTIETINRLIDEGNAIAFASGRCKIGVLKFIKQIKNNGNNYMVTSNGAVVYKYGDEKPYYEKRLQIRNLVEICGEFGKKDDRFIYCYHKDKLAYLKYHEYVKIEEESNDMGSYQVNLEEVPLDTPVDKVMIQGRPEVISNITIPQCFYENYNVVKTSGWFIEFTSKDADKVVGVDFLKKKLNIKDEDVYVFGDSENDLRMVSKYNGIAMENGYDCVKKAAKYVTKSVYEDGITYAVKNLLGF